MPSSSSSSHASSMSPGSQKQTAAKSAEKPAFHTPGASSDPSASRTRDAASSQERKRQIAERAYDLAAKRNFVGGDAVNDWLEAERVIDATSIR